jgi:hypothetical protein
MVEMHQQIQEVLVVVEELEQMEQMELEEQATIQPLLEELEYNHQLAELQHFMQAAVELEETCNFNQTEVDQVEMEAAATEQLILQLRQHQLQELQTQAVAVAEETFLAVLVNLDQQAAQE